MKNTIPKLSLCMIVKNEEETLARCLKSVKSIVSEIIIADTGSTDRTQAIAREFGATSLHYAWADDFCAARNYCLDHVNGEWVLVLDADEVLIYDSNEQIAQLLTDSLAEGYFIRVVNLLGDMAVRLFRNRPEYRFEGAIHEQIKTSINRIRGEHTLKKVPLMIYHDGYLAENIKKKEKVQRNSRVINKALSDTPNNPFLLYSLGCEYFIAENFTGAASVFTRALDLISLNEDYLPDLIIKTGLCLYKLGNQAKILQLFNYYQDMSSLSPGLLFLSAVINLYKEDLKQAEKNIRKCMQKVPIITASHLPIMEHQLYQTLGDFKAAKRAWKEALYFYFFALKAKPYCLSPLYKMTNIFREQNHNQQIEDFLSFCPTENKNLLLSKLLKAKDTEAAIFFILAVCRDIIISDLVISQLIIPKALSVLDSYPLNEHNCDDWRLNTSVCLAKSFLHISGYKSVEPGNSAELCEKLWEIMKQVLLTK